MVLVFIYKQLMCLALTLKPEADQLTFQLFVASCKCVLFVLFNLFLLIYLILFIDVNFFDTFNQQLSFWSDKQCLSWV